MCTMIDTYDINTEFERLFGSIEQTKLINLNEIEMFALREQPIKPERIKLPFDNISFSPQPTENYKLFSRHWQLKGRSKRMVLTKRRTCSVEFDGKIQEIIQLLLQNAKSKVAIKNNQKKVSSKSKTPKKKHDGLERMKSVVRIQEESLEEKMRKRLEIEHKYEDFAFESSHLSHKKKDRLIKLSNNSAIFTTTETLESKLSSYVDNTPEKNHREFAKQENILHSTYHIFNIMQVGKCDAKGYYNNTNGCFYILKGSLVSAEFETQLSSSPLKNAWKKFIDENCEFCSSGKRILSTKVKKVKEDFRCEKASIAASFVLGRAANNAHWRDSEGHLLKDIYPNEFALTHM